MRICAAQLKQSNENLLGNNAEHIGKLFTNTLLSTTTNDKRPKPKKTENIDSQTVKSIAKKLITFTLV